MLKALSEWVRWLGTSAWVDCRWSNDVAGAVPRIGLKRHNGRERLYTAPFSTA